MEKKKVIKEIEEMEQLRGENLMEKKRVTILMSFSGCYDKCKKTQQYVIF